MIEDFEKFKAKLIEEGFIHDARMDRVTISKESSQTTVTIIFRSHKDKSKDSLVAIEFLGVRRFDFLEDECDKYLWYVASYKFFKINDNEYYISLDPDENAWEVLDTDGMVIIFNDIKIHTLS